ncbi:MAG: iron ABC transporter permease [Anaerolineae bacterium]|nr:iron ABC transporter permease [Anaerolineae bacterium]
MSAQAVFQAPTQKSPEAGLSLSRRRLIIRTVVVVLAGLLLAGAMIVSLGRGSKEIPARDVINALRDSDSVAKSTYIIVHKVRLPRALTGALVGMNLAVAGTMLQGAVRSPLADPYILGVSAGGGLVAAYIKLRIPDAPPHAVPTGAFIGSLVGAMIVYLVAWDGSGVTATRLALAGVALTTAFGAFTTTIVGMSIQAGGQVIFQWMIGGLYTADWADYYLIAPYTLAGFLLAMLLATRANVLALGDEMAQGLGLRVEWTRFLMSAVAAVLAGSSVAVAGLIGFVGLLVPYVARKLVGSDYRFLIPTCAILGAALMVWADWSAQVFFPKLLDGPDTSIQFPVGIVTAVIGGPLFLWLVRARRAQW